MAPLANCQQYLNMNLSHLFTGVLFASRAMKAGFVCQEKYAAE